MFKIFGILLLSAVPIVFGLRKSQNLMYQKQEVSEIIGLIARCRQGIAYQQLPLASLIQQLPKQQSQTIDRLREHLQNGASPMSAWQDTAKGICCPVILPIMNDFFSALGTSDKESQLNICDMTSARLEEIRLMLEADAPAKTKLYRTVGVLAGAFIAILLI